MNFKKQQTADACKANQTRYYISVKSSNRLNSFSYADSLAQVRVLLPTITLNCLIRSEVNYFVDTR